MNKVSADTFLDHTFKIYNIIPHFAKYMNKNECTAWI